MVVGYHSQTATVGKKRLTNHRWKDGSSKGLSVWNEDIHTHTHINTHTLALT